MSLGARLKELRNQKESISSRGCHAVGASKAHIWKSNVEAARTVNGFTEPDRQPFWRSVSFLVGEEPPENSPRN